MLIDVIIDLHAFILLAPKFIKAEVDYCIFFIKYLFQSEEIIQNDLIIDE